MLEDLTIFWFRDEVAIVDMVHARWEGSAMGLSQLRRVRVIDHRGWTPETELRIKTLIQDGLDFMRLSPPVEVSEMGPFASFEISSLHDISYNGKVYSSARQLYNALPFLPQYPLIADIIRREKRVKPDAYDTYKRYVRPDWNSIFRHAVRYICFSLARP